MDRVLYTHRWMQLIENKDGDAFVRTANAVLLIPIDDEGRLVFVRELSPAFGHEALALPTGEISMNEAPEHAAERELREEIGHRPARLRFVGRVHPSVKYLSAETLIYEATGLEHAPLDGDEPNGVAAESVHPGDVPGLIRAGRLTDASSIAALALAGFLPNG
ncbi:MAG: NUDIX domain-containing protein [Anaerolineae bacterium]|nr:NUDIX domain-containing protein [Anaerolineae bacterium]